MNLLELLKQELKTKNIIDKQLIARYIYIRIGELFDYDESYLFENWDEQQKLKESIVDKKQIIYFKLICYNWSKLYKELLNDFGIEAELVPDFGHQYVKYTINKEIYCADLTQDYEDIYRIKCGLPTIGNYPIYKSKQEQQNIVNQWDKQIGYRKNTEIMLSMLKKELQEKYPNKEDYIYNSYKAVQYIMQFPKERMEHTSGRKYIHFLLKYFLEDLYKYCNGKFYSIENNIFIQAYGVQLSNQFIYYLYRRKNKQGYSFQEVPKKTIKFLFQEKILKRAYTQELEKTL